MCGQNFQPKAGLLASTVFMGAGRAAGGSAGGMAGGAAGIGKSKAAHQRNRQTAEADERATANKGGWLARRPRFGQPKWSVGAAAPKRGGRGNEKDGCCGSWLGWWPTCAAGKCRAGGQRGNYGWNVQGGLLTGGAGKGMETEGTAAGGKAAGQ